MLQRKLNGITLSKYLLTNMRNGSLRDPYPYYREVQKQVTQQQDRIGYWHGDAHDNNILVDAETGKFISLIDWDTASEKFQWDAT
jgi:Ser/Thr protein kinase RdoA (MazF antagonist)